MPANLFLQSDVLKGSYPPDDTLDVGKLIKIESISHEMELPVAPLRPSFSKAAFHSGVLKHNPFVVTRTADMASASLVDAFLTRTTVPYLQVISGIMAKAADNKFRILPVWTLRVTDALLTQFSYESAEDGRFTEKFGIQYSSLCWLFGGEKQTGELIATPTFAGINKDNSKVTDPTAGDFADSKFSGAQANRNDYFDVSKW